MLSVIWSKKRGSCQGASCKGSMDEGLRIITSIANGNSNVVVKPIFLLNETVKSTNSSAPDYSHSCCYLKARHLCQKPLSLDKEIYMYRGDLGFCSVECRDRQIYLDELKEIETSTKQILQTFRRDGGGRCETNRLVDEFRKRRPRPFPSQKSRVIFS